VPSFSSDAHIHMCDMCQSAHSLTSTAPSLPHSLTPSLPHSLTPSPPLSHIHPCTRTVMLLR
jgi:hypothetical protein